MKTLLLPIFDNLIHWNNRWNETHRENVIPDDKYYVAQFLYAYRGSEPTFNAYRRECERFLQWLQLVAHKTLKEVTASDIESFVAFCQSPPLDWIGTKNISRFMDKDGLRVPHSEWRPFVVNVSKSLHGAGISPDRKKYVLSQKAVQAIFAVLSSFYQFLIHEQVMAHNPVSQIRQKSKFIRKQIATQVVRRLSDLQWHCVLETTEQLAKENPALHERSLFIMNALYGMYLRISELASSPRWQPVMGHFRRDTDGHWWFTTVGKGNKERSITVSDAMLAALKRYRLSRGLSALPSIGESTPLITSQRGNGPVTSTRQIRFIVQDCFDAAVVRLQQEGFAEEAEQLKTATVHWLRHTGISDDVKHRPREHVRDDAGHSSGAITDRYIDIELRARHASGRHKKIKPDI